MNIPPKYANPANTETQAQSMLAICLMRKDRIMARLNKLDALQQQTAQALAMVPGEQERKGLDGQLRAIGFEIATIRRDYLPASQAAISEWQASVNAERQETP